MIAFKGNTCYDLFVDLISTENNHASLKGFLRYLENEEGHWGEERIVTVAMPAEMCSTSTSSHHGRPWANFFVNPVAALASALRGAATNNRAIIVVIGAWNYSNNSSCVLLEYVDSDPMIGTIQPRFFDDEAKRVFALPGGAGGTKAPSSLTFLPEYYITTELLSVYFVITPRGVLSAPKIDVGSISDAYSALLRGLRRRGFRNLVCNRITVACGLPEEQVYLPMNDDFKTGFPSDQERPIEWLRDLPERKLETILSSAFNEEGRPRLLLDCRGMGPLFNGTSASILGFLRGFHQMHNCHFSISILVSEKAESFHDLAIRFPNFEFLFEFPSDTFVVVILMNQPWSVSAIRDIHSISCLSMFNMLDTITWDIAYCAPQGLDETWRILGMCADAIFFNSAYSRDRYKFRFHPNPRIPCVVTHHSTALGELRKATVADPLSTESFLLLVGNHYDHKAIVPTLATLSEAFPYTAIRVVGIENYDAYNVTCMNSGDLSDATITTLFAGAIAIVFPSFYEGFGLPVVEALANEKTVIVRDCPIWNEIALLSFHSDMIVPFRTDADLVAAVGRALHGHPQTMLDKLPKPALRSEVSWTDCADKILQTASYLAVNFDSRHWLARQALLGA